jgi:hypothetical protein
VQVTKAAFPFKSQSAAKAVTGSKHKGFRQVIRCLAHIDHAVTVDENEDDDGTAAEYGLPHHGSSR